MTNLLSKINALKPGEFLSLTPKGFSMCPTFLGGRDQVYVTAPDFPLSKGDIAIFLRKDDTYVIHRVCKVKSQNEYYFLGDNQTKIEGPIFEEQIHGIVTHIVKKGKVIDCNKNFSYKLYSKLWLFFRPLRPFFRFCFNTFRKL